MPFPGAPHGFICNSKIDHDPDVVGCSCSKCVRSARPGLIEGAPYQVNEHFPVDHLVGLYEASALNIPPVPVVVPVCCFKDPEDNGGDCQDVAEWNVWHETLGNSNPDGVVLPVCGDHLVDVLSSEGRNVVWADPSAEAYLKSQREESEGEEPSE